MSAKQGPQHTLERRSALLAQKLGERMGDLTQALQAANGRIPFHTKLTRQSALEWWAQHRYDSLGQQAMAGLDQPAILNLDTALAQHAQQMQGAGLPVEGTPDQNAAAALGAGQGGPDASTGP